MIETSKDITVFSDRHQAGRLLGQKLAALNREGSLPLENAIVIALPRGGLPVGYEVAKELKLPLDVFVVRKIGVPFQPELAAGAVAEGGALVVNKSVARMAGLSESQLESLAVEKQKEITARVKKFRAGRGSPPIENKTVLLVDDGMATGATALSAVRLLRNMGAARISLALPVCPADTVSKFADEVDDFIALESPSYFQAVGQWYANFTQVGDEEVVEYLERARSGPR